MNLRFVSLLVGVALALVACEPADPPRFTTTDSAGVTIAVSRTAAWDADPAAHWIVDTVPRLDLTTTGNGPEHEFYRAVDGAVLNDGRIVVADDGSTQIRIYAPDGAFVVSTGREGEGPGEFEQISTLEVLGGDTLGVFSWPDRWTVLAPDLSVARIANLGVRAWSPMALPDRHVATFEAFASMLEHEGGNGMIRPPASVVKRDAEGAVVDTLWTGPGHEEFMVADGDQRSAMRPLFGKGPAFDVRDGVLYVGTSDALAYTMIDADGAVLRHVRVPNYDLSVSREAVERERASYLPEGPVPPAYRARVAALPEPDTRPAYRDFFVDTEGHLWAGALRSRTTLDDPWPFEIFSPEGEWLGSLTLPPRFDVFEIGSDYVLGSRRDALDVEHVQMLPLRRGAGGG